MVPGAGAHLSAAVAASRRRILLVAPQPFFAVRGTPMNVLQMVRALCGAGHEVHLVTYALGEPVDVAGLVHHRAPRPPGVRTVAIGFSGRKILLDVLLAMHVWWLLLTRRFDVVHAVEESIFFTLPLARARGIPVIYDLDSSISDQLEYTGVLRRPMLLRAVRAVEAAHLRRSSLAITVCRALTDTVRRLEPSVPVAQIEDCPLDEMLRAPDPEAVAAIRARFALEGCRVVVYTGNLESYQGMDLLLEALPALAERHRDVRLVIVGGEPHQVEALRARLDGGVLQDLVVLVGRQPPATVVDFMAAGEVLVSPRRAGENTPLKLFSYMYSGVPVVATDLPTHTQVLDETTAVLCAPNAAALARALGDVLDDPAGFRVRGRAAKARVAERYSREAFARKLLGAYGAVLSGRFAA